VDILQSDGLTFGAIQILGFVTATLITALIAFKKHINTANALLFFFSLTIVCYLAGSTAHLVLYKGSPDTFVEFISSSSIIGSVCAFIVLFTWSSFSVSGRRLVSNFDNFTFAIMPWIVIGKYACSVAGCCFGSSHQFPIADYILILNQQHFELLFFVASFSILTIVYFLWKQIPPGVMTSLFGIVVSALRILFEQSREDQAQIWFGVRAPIYVAFITILVSLYALYLSASNPGAIDSESGKS